MPTTWRKKKCCCWLLLGLTVFLPACGWDGQFTVLGYSTRPNYDSTIKTVYVPIFGNQTFSMGWAQSQIEMDLTRAVIREIEAKTPYKVTSNRATADTELVGKIVSLTKTVINANQLNEAREAQTVMNVEIVWRDLRPGRQGDVLSAQRQGGPGAPAPFPLGPDMPPLPPTLVTSYGSFVDEVGGSITSAFKENVDRTAVQIISMMEKPW